MSSTIPDVLWLMALAAAVGLPICAWLLARTLARYRRQRRVAARAAAPRTVPQPHAAKSAADKAIAAALGAVREPAPARTAPSPSLSPAAEPAPPRPTQPARALRTPPVASLPLVPPPPPPPPPPSVLPRVADLLLVDDSAVARAKLRKLFEAQGYAVHLARDGVEALALLDKGRYALMITDLEMPNMDGVALIDHCLRRPGTARMPILAISGHENLRAKFNACRDIAGIHRKPWIDDVLLSHVAALLSEAETRPAALVD